MAQPPPRSLPKLPGLPNVKGLPPLPGSNTAAAIAAPKPAANIPGLQRGPAAAAAPVSSREATKAARELQEQRSMGLAPLAVDAVSGEEISPMVPHSVSTVPWFHSASGSSTLTHQRKEAAQVDIAALAAAPAGVTPTPASAPVKLTDGSTSVGGMRVVGQATGYRPGACKNCGSMSHKERDCTERRRVVNVQHKPVNIAPDVQIDDGAYDKKTFEHKRDRTAGIDVAAAAEAAFAKGPSIADGVGEATTVPEPAKKSLRCEDSQLAAASTSGSLRSESRELPKYLFNLNSGSALFDPATRAMRGNPQALKADQDERYVVRSVQYEGDNARSHGGGFQEATQQILFAYNRSRDGEAASSVAANSPFLPTANDVAFKAARAAEAAAAAKKQATLEAVYGGALPSASDERPAR